ncbi:uncharacterized protein LOC126840775 [Adelges cooleyi]|uniref:uncharacterized protein LOC126840775 n=1 Tax=Adelges cooleyi TaxID=133065 RepID=UPI00217F622E|nr:uncharacterized protein LOC126840775 [Adelges cooleyi]
MGWKRPAGPPRVWQTVNVIEENGKARVFSIEEIPEGRYEQALELLVSCYIPDYPLWNACKTRDPSTVEYFRKRAKLILQQGISIAVFEHLADDGQTSILAGVNLLSYSDDDHANELKQVERSGEVIRSRETFFNGIYDKWDPKKLYKLNSFLADWGLGVKPAYRKMGLGLQMLEARGKIGREYDLPYTFTLFGASASQRIAAKANFFEISSGDFTDLQWPELDGQTWKLMGKRLF